MSQSSWGSAEIWFNLCYCEQALLRRTLDDYKRAGYDPTSSSLEIRLIQSQDDIRNPNVELKAERYRWSRWKNVTYFYLKIRKHRYVYEGKLVVRSPFWGYNCTILLYNIIQFRLQSKRIWKSSYYAFKITPLNGSLFRLFCFRWSFFFDICSFACMFFLYLLWTMPSPSRNAL